MKIALSQLATAALTLLIFSGCASVSVKESRFTEQKYPLRTPSIIFVRPFVFAPGALRVDRSGEDLRKFESIVAAQMANRLVELLGTSVAPARLATLTERIQGKNIWVVEGQFDRLNQGSRALRSVVGFGLGGTKMETTALVYSLDKKGQQTLLARIQTTGGSNAVPGAVLSGPVVAVPRLIFTAATTGVSSDSKRTARMITAALSEQLSKAGAPLPAPALRPKRRQVTEQPPQIPIDPDY